jgi:hypothetical protein
MFSLLNLTTFASLLVVAAAIDPRVPAAKAEAAVAETSLERRSHGCVSLNPFGGASPNTDYYTNKPGGCPGGLQMTSTGSCPLSFGNSGSTSCQSYCEVKDSFFYGQEVPFSEFSGCREDQECSFTSTKSLSITQTWSFNMGGGLGDIGSEDDIKGAFDFGASYSYSTTQTTATGLVLSRPTNNNASDCGYWTFVPIFWTSCGTLTVSPVYSQSGQHGSSIATSCMTSKLTNVPNYCNTTPYLTSGGNQAGETVFVVVGCNSNLLQPASMQDPIFRYPGVSRSPFPTTVQT